MISKRYLYGILVASFIALIMTFKTFIDTALDYNDFVFSFLVELAVLWFWYMPTIVLILLCIIILKDMKKEEKGCE